VEYRHPPTLLNFLGFQSYLQDTLNEKVDVIEYPIDYRYLTIKDFSLGKTLKLYE
jgi:predicted nucleotidyltransferase